MVNRNKTSILLPSAYRPLQLSKSIDLIYATVGLLPIEICVSVVSDDFHSQNILRGASVVYDVRSVAEYERGAVYAWNKLYKLSTGGAVVLWADDLIPHPYWLDYTLTALGELGGHGLVALNDRRGDNFAAHWLANREWLEQHGDVAFPPEYKSWYCDREISEVAQAEGRYCLAEHALIDHLHYAGVQSDRTYIDARENYEADRLLYEQRKAERLNRANPVVLPA